MQEGAVRLIMRNVLIVSAYSIRYLSRMFTRFVAAQILAMLGAVLCATAACSQLHLPNMLNAPPQLPVIPASVTLFFDDSVRKATLEQTVCAETLWKGRLGDAIIKAFEETGRTRFAQTKVADTAEAPQPASSPSTTAVTAAIKLVHSSFTTRTRTGDSDNYTAQLDIQLIATFQDTNGKQFPEAPLNFSEQVSIWTPQYGGGNQCSTGQLDGAMNKAAEHLAVQLTGYVAELTAKAKGQTVAGGRISGSALPFGAGSALTLRATLLDENNNLLLEGGEKVGVRIDVTNTGTTPTTPSTVTLSGNPALIDAFAGTLTSPVTVAALQPGETTSAMLWGKLPANLEGTRGELTVTVTPSEATGGTPATQTLVAAMASRGSTTVSAPSPAVRPAPIASGLGPDPERYAVIVGLSLYRSPWPGWRDGLSFDSKETISLFANSLAVPEENTLLLQDELAGQTDIEEALAQWLPKRIKKDSIVFFYYAGQTVADPKNGEVFLIPYDATPASSPFRLISIRFLQSRLQKLGAKLAIAILDSPTTMRALPKDGKAKAPAQNWIGDLDGSYPAKAGAMVQVARLAGTRGSQQGLLQGLTGPADLDRDGIVTVGEWLRSLRGTAITAPTLPPALSVQSIPLAHVNHR
ncbi:hypothetical protein [Petrachloros mirabilis]